MTDEKLPPEPADPTVTPEPESAASETNALEARASDGARPEPAVSEEPVAEAAAAPVEEELVAPPAPVAHSPAAARLSGAQPAAAPAPRRPRSFLAERPEGIVAISRDRLRRSTRRDFLLFGAGAAAAAAGIWWLLPEETRSLHLTRPARQWLDSIEARAGATGDRRETFLNRVLTFDDDVAEALYSVDRSVRTYDRSQVTPLKNNYDGETPTAASLAGWSLSIMGLASGRREKLAREDLVSRFPRHDQVTRICCVEGWSAVAWWGGLRFGDFLKAFPPAPGARWAKLESSVNLDSSGDPDPYYVSIDLPTARHPQTLLATHWNGAPLTLEHGWPLRLVAPMKLGLKNIKAITSISYTVAEPADYWNERGYSRYDGL